MDQRSDEELLAVVRRDAEAFAEFYRRHVDRMLGFALRRLDRPEEVADLVAAVFVRVIESADRFDPHRGQALPWLFGALVVLDGLTPAQAAQALGVRPTALRARMTRARRKLRRAMDAGRRPHRIRSPGRNRGVEAMSDRTRQRYPELHGFTERLLEGLTQELEDERRVPRAATGAPAREPRVRSGPMSFPDRAARQAWTADGKPVLDSRSRPST